MNSFEQPPRIVRWTLRLEEATALDRPAQALEPWIQGLFGTGTRASVLRGEWLGHAVHPPLTDVVLGTWTSASLPAPPSRSWMRSWGACPTRSNWPCRPSSWPVSWG